MTTERLTFLSRRNCPLCASAQGALAELATLHNLGVSEFDIDEDDVLCARFSDRVPVVLYKGQVIAEGRIEPARLQQALNAVLRDQIAGA
jgi:ABC-type hemin transport system ATPase subunit